MKKILPILIAILIIPLMGCMLDKEWDDSYPTYPSGGEYDGGGGSSGGGGTYYPPYDDHESDWARDVVGEWEGFMWEDYRSDGRPLSKKKVAMRLAYSDHDSVNINVLIDGRPTASRLTNVSSSGYISFSSYKNDIDFSMSGHFRNSGASGDINLRWDEKVENKYDGGTDKHNVRIRGEFNAGRVCGAQWAAAWELFDLYEDGIWDLPDDVWEAATFEGIEHLAAIEDTFVRAPVIQ